MRQRRQSSSNLSCHKTRSPQSTRRFQDRTHQHQDRTHRDNTHQGNTHQDNIHQDNTHQHQHHTHQGNIHQHQDLTLQLQSHTTHTAGLATKTKFPTTTTSLCPPTLSRCQQTRVPARQHSTTNHQLSQERGLWRLAEIPRTVRLLLPGTYQAIRRQIRVVQCMRWIQGIMANNSTACGIS